MMRRRDLLVRGGSLVLMLGASANCCGATACLRSTTRRTTRGWFWPTRTPAV